MDAMAESKTKERLRIYEIVTVHLGYPDTALHEVELWNGTEMKGINNEFQEKSEAMEAVRKYCASNTDYVILSVISK